MMDFLASLLQQDMFFAVVCYLTVGLVFLVYFFYREKKWESDLIQYQIKNVPPGIDVSASQGTDIFAFGKGLERISAMSPVLLRPLNNTGLSEEMQVVAGEVFEPESPTNMPVNMPVSVAATSAAPQAKQERKADQKPVLKLVSSSAGSIAARR